jgi:signal transduction histidine kinase
VAVNEAIRHAVLLVRTQVAESGLSLVTKGCSEPNGVMADPDRLRQILLNLLTNSIKFTPPGGRITIECASAGPMVEIRVIDEGIGIEADDLERVFSPFVQVHPAGRPVRSEGQRGVGLGLAISRDLARAMGGDVTVRSTPGAGSVFTLSLPAAGQTADIEARQTA